MLHKLFGYCSVRVKVRLKNNMIASTILQKKVQCGLSIKFLTTCKHDEGKKMVQKEIYALST